MGLGVVINWSAVIWASVASFILGFLWYSPALFGNLWMKLSGYKAPKKGQKPEGMMHKMVSSFVGTIITSYVLASLIVALEITTLNAAAGLGFFVWLGFIASTTLLGASLWDNKPIQLFYLNGAYWLVNMVVMAKVLILAA